MDLSIWTEKYRPKKLKEVINQEHVVDRLKSFVKKEKIPHMIFAGPPGTGKTCCAIAIARELYGRDWRNNFQETNASVTGDCPVLVRNNGKVKRTTFKRIAENNFENNSSKYSKPNNLEVLSIDRNYKIKFIPVSLISRHKVKKIARIKYEGGSVKTSLNHSVIVLDEKCQLTSKRVSELKMGDLLITLKTMLKGKEVTLDFDKYLPNLYNKLKPCWVRNPKIKTLLRNMKLTPELSWLFGLYTAEGCVSFHGDTSGVIIFSLSYPHETPVVQKVNRIIENKFNLDTTLALSGSGFNRDRKSSIQIRTYNTQLARYISDYFYKGEEKCALTKKFPSFIFNSLLKDRIEFLKGYMGDAMGEWKRYIRYSSRSRDNLVDTSWLARMSGFDSSYFKEESRIVWKIPSSSYIKTELIPAKPLIKFFENIANKAKFNWRYDLRHQLYHKKSKRISKEIAKKILVKIDKKHLNENERKKYEILLKLIKSDISFVEIKKIEKEKNDDFVYDFSVPGTEMFWGGTTPILLHNSDMRGINVIRTRIKNFSRIKPIGTSFKIIFLDEADALTSDAQNALRRLMEKYSSVTRFILSCNYSSNIISPIQSRAALFRFKFLSKENVFDYLKRIKDGEKLKITKDAFEGIYEISEGDLRKATNLLQASAILGKKITKDVIYEAAAKAEPKDVKKMIENALNGKFLDAREILKELLLKKGISGQDIIKQVSREIYDLNVSERVKIKLIEKIGDFEFRLDQGGNEQIQLEALLAQFTLK